MLFDRICHNNGIKHRLTAPYSPTTTGKVERFHRTYRNEFLADHNRKNATVEEAQKALDTWVDKYDTERPHQSLGDRPPAERFALAAPRRPVDTTVELVAVDDPKTSPRPPGVSRWVDQRGSIGLSSFRYRVGPTFAGEAVEVVVHGGLVEILHKGVLVATHAERRRDGVKTTAHRAPRAGRARPPSSGLSVTRVVDTGGSISFAGADYRVGRGWRGRSVEVAIVAGSVQISENAKVIRVHQIRHDRSKEHGAFATPHGRPRNRKSA